MADKAWTGKTGGTPRMQRSLIAIFRHLDPRWLYPVVAVWVWFYILFQPQGTKGIYHYWRRLLGRRPLAAAYHTYLTYFRFGTVILDRFAAYSGRQFDITIDGKDVLDRLTSQADGLVLLSTHVGNQEQAGYTIRMPKPLRVLLSLGDTQTVNENRRKLFEKQGITFIPMAPDGSHVFAMHETLQKGEMLSCHCDRFYYGGRVIKTMVFGEPAPFPEGPFKLAAVEEKRVMTMFMMKERGNRYTLYVRELPLAKEGTLRYKAQRLLESFVHEEEAILRRYPHQWFHFYNFWTADR